jgi:hypothetical protein
LFFAESEKQDGIIFKMVRVSRLWQHLGVSEKLFSACAYYNRFDLVLLSFIWIFIAGSPLVFVLVYLWCLLTPCFDDRGVFVSTLLGEPFLYASYASGPDYDLFAALTANCSFLYENADRAMGLHNFMDYYCVEYARDFLFDWEVDRMPSVLDVTVRRRRRFFITWQREFFGNDIELDSDDDEFEGNDDADYAKHRFTFH